MALGAHTAAANLEGVDLLHGWANDFDADACATYVSNIPGSTKASVHCLDVRHLEIQSLPAIDGLAFGFPCNDFSSVGKSRGLDGEYGPLYSYGVSALDWHNPKWFVAENVSGLRSANAGTAFSQILAEMSQAGDYGYNLTPHLYSFDKYGVPQRRKRIIIVGVRADLEQQFNVPSPRPFEEMNVSAAYALTNPPMNNLLKNHELTRQSEKVVERLRHILPGQNAFTAALPDHLQLNVKGAKISQIYRRLRAEQPSYTVTGSGGGGTHVYHWDEPRALTNRERARLQSFPDDYIFIGTKESVRKQIGMAVPAKGAEAVFTALFKSLLGVPYEFIPSNISPVAASARRQSGP